MPDTERQWSDEEIEAYRHAAPPHQPRVVEGIADVDQTPDLFPLADLDDEGGAADGQ